MSNLNSSRFSSVLSDDFTSDKSLNYKNWTATWGNANQYNFTGTSTGLILSSSAATNWNSVGFMQAPNVSTGGQGYGLFSFTGNAGVVGQGVGICFVLWPADNKWNPSSQPSKASEIDLLESQDGTKTGFSTLHYYTASNPSNQTNYVISNYTLTQPHTYSLDWEKGSLTFYIDGKEIWQNINNVPLDAADGGVNRSIGAEIANASSHVTTPTVQLDIQKITYSAPAGPNIIASSPGTIMEASIGAGVNFNETVAATSLSTVYAEVLTSSGAVETGYQAVALNSVGVATVAMHLAKSGDYVQIVDNVTNPTVIAKSDAVVITDPPTIGLSSPGTVQGVHVGVGVTVSETVSTTNVAKGVIYAEVMTSSGAVESGYRTVSTGANGSATFNVTFNQSGDYIKAVDNTTTPGVTSLSSAVTITPPPPITSPFISITSVTEDAGRLIMNGDKEVGMLASMREYMDGKYLGVLRSNFADGPFSMHIADVAAGSHVLSLGLDASSATATYNFTKQADGSVIPALHAVASASVLPASTIDHSYLSTPSASLHIA